MTAPAIPRSQQVRRATAAGAPRLTVTTLPTLDPAQSAHLDAFWSTLHAIACRELARDTAAVA